MTQENNIATIILAAGQGTRMKSNKSKVLHKVADKTLISYVVDTAIKLQCKETVIVVSDKSDEVQKEVKRCNPDARFVVQKEQLAHLLFYLSRINYGV